MSMDLSVQKFEMEPARFEAGVYPIAKAVKTAKEALPKHAPVALNTEGKLELLTADNVSNVFGVLPDSIRADEEGPVYLTGEFFADSLEIPGEVDEATVETALRKIGIFLK